MYTLSQFLPRMAFFEFLILYIAAREWTVTHFTDGVHVSQFPLRELMSTLSPECFDT